MDGLALPLDEALKLEAEAFGDCFETEDRLIGVQSFLDHGQVKRPSLGSRFSGTAS